MLEDLTHALEALFTDLRASLAAAGKTFDAGVLGQRMAGIQRSLAVSVAELDDKNHTLQDLNRRLLQAYEIIENTNIVLMEWTLVQDIPTKFVTENIRQYGFEPQDFYTGFLKDYWDFIHPDDRNAARTLVHQMRARHVADYKHRYRVVCRDGAVRWVEENTLLDFDETGIPIRERGILYDITNIMEIDDQIRYLGYHDALTGLFNRAWFDEKIAELEREQRFPYAVVIGDMNGLKVTNDLFGHKAGDDLLVAAAAIMQRSCRDSDIICRFGGDEFIILLPGGDEAVAIEVCQRIRQQCAKANCKPVNPNLALGYATRGPETVSAEALIKLADDMMYRTKLDEAVVARQGLLLSLQASLEARTMETAAHAEQVQRLALALGRAAGLDDQALEQLAIAGLLHDVGKVGVPDELLLKPDVLTEEEWVTMRKHCELGSAILGASAGLPGVGELVLHHHERWDGGGYPAGLAGEAILLGSRIIGIADAFDVMGRPRPYRPAKARLEVLTELQSGAGRQFDPALVALFCQLVAAGLAEAGADPAADSAAIAPLWVTRRG